MGMPGADAALAAACRGCARYAGGYSAAQRDPAGCRRRWQAQTPVQEPEQAGECSQQTTSSGRPGGGILCNTMRSATEYNQLLSDA